MSMKDCYLLENSWKKRILREHTIIMNTQLWFQIINLEESWIRIKVSAKNLMATTWIWGVRLTTDIPHPITLLFKHIPISYINARQGMYLHKETTVCTNLSHLRKEYFFKLLQTICHSFIHSLSIAVHTLEHLMYWPFLLTVNAWNVFLTIRSSAHGKNFG